MRLGIKYSVVFFLIAHLGTEFASCSNNIIIIRIVDVLTKGF